MDDYLVNLAFAGDALTYIFALENIPWESPYEGIFEKNSEKRKFSIDIGWALWLIWDENTHDFDACHRELKKARIKGKEFSKCALSAADSYFSKGYSHGSFLGYCAIVLTMATDYFEFPSNGVPEAAIGVVALVLLGHQLTGQFYEHGGWGGIHKTCRRLQDLYPERSVK